jgi:hypothetical protein
MAKKVRRVRKSRTAKEEVTGDKNGSKSRLSSAEQFRLEYAYVLKDLRQVLILAVVMFALLILLNLVLR